MVPVALAAGLDGSVQIPPPLHALADKRIANAERDRAAATRDHYLEIYGCCPRCGSSMQALSTTRTSMYPGLGLA